MTGENWTPGPWRAESHDFETEPNGVTLVRIEVVAGDGGLVHEHVSQYAVHSANAHLISAAPELYALLLEVPPLADLEKFVRDEWFDERERALAKARGEVLP